MKKLSKELMAFEALGLLGDRQKKTLEAWRQKHPVAYRKEAIAYGHIKTALAASCPPVKPPARLRKKMMGYLDTLKPARGYFVVPENKGNWEACPEEGCHVRELVNDPRGRYKMLLMTIAPNTYFPAHYHGDAEECYVVSGDLHSQGRVFKSGDFIHADGGTSHRKLYTKNGCRLLVLVAPENSGEF